ncbi:MAG: glycine betaine ABC transporter substrate-binding protein, partial [Gammaproteobacteria bacterium]
MRIAIGTTLALTLASLAFGEESPLVTVGSKPFTESVILGEIATQLLENEGIRVQHQAQLGGTRFLWAALLAGEIDLYVEYTGTLRTEILGRPPDVETDPTVLRRALLEHGVRM